MRIIIGTNVDAVRVIVEYYVLTEFLLLFLGCGYWLARDLSIWHLIYMEVITYDVASSTLCGMLVNWDEHVHLYFNADTWPHTPIITRSTSSLPVEKNGHTYPTVTVSCWIGIHIRFGRAMPGISVASQLKESVYTIRSGITLASLLKYILDYDRYFIFGCLIQCYYIIFSSDFELLIHNTESVIWFGICDSVGRRALLLLRSSNISYRHFIFHDIWVFDTMLFHHI